MTASQAPQTLSDVRDAKHPNEGGGNALLDAPGAAALLAVPKSWVLAEARAGRIPHCRLGRYVRFDPAELLAWARGPRHVGPRATGRGPGAPLERAA
jgi:excisionase family DNA binding protein